MIDVKLSVVGTLFLAITFSDAEVALKIIASVLMIGYTGRRWYLLEKNNAKPKDDE